MSLLEKLEKQKFRQEKEARLKKAAVPPPRDPYAGLRAELHKKIVSELKDIPPADRENNEFMSRRIEQLAMEILSGEEQKQIPKLDRVRLASELVDEIIGYGPINSLLNDPDISEVMVNGPNQVYVEKNGCITLTDVFFRDDNHVDRKSVV